MTFELKKNHVAMPVQHITLRPEGGLPLILRRGKSLLCPGGRGRLLSKRISRLDDIGAAAN
jgi:hypothetical protein